MGLFFCYLFRPTCPIYCGLESVRARLVMGHVDYVVYLVLLGLHNKGLAYGNPHQAVAKARRQMMWRLALIGAFVVIGLQIPGVRAESLLISVVLIQPVLYIVFWRLSK